MLEEIGIWNFKAHKATNLSFAPINIFIGQNNTGKTSVFQIIQLLKQALKNNQYNELVPDSEPIQGYVDQEEEDKTKKRFFVISNPEMVNLGPYEELVQDQSVPLKVYIAGKDHGTPDSIDIKQKIYSFKYEASFLNNSFYSFQGSISGDEQSIETELITKDEIHRSSDMKIIFDKYTANIRFNGRPGTPLEWSGSGSTEISRETIETYEHRSKYFLETYPRFFNSCRFIYGIRGLEKRYYDLIENPNRDIETTYLHLRNIALISTLPHDRNLEDKINEFFKPILGIQIQFQLYKKDFIDIKIISTAPKHTLINEGLGSQQLFSLFCPMALAPFSSTIFIEEPENHLHPTAQAEVVNALIRAQKNRKFQYVISTHSEHILLNFLLMIKKGEISSKDLRIYYFSLNDQNIAQVTSLEIDEDGRINGSLPGFFDANMKLIGEMLK